MTLPDPKTRSTPDRPAAEGPVGPRPRESRGDGPGFGGTPGEGDRPTADLAPEPAEAEFDREQELALVSQVLAGQQDAFAVLLERYQGRVYRMVRRMWSRDRELAEDLTQEVFLRVFRGLPRFQGDCGLGTWIHRITMNVCISELRQRKAAKRDRRTISLDAPVRGDGDDGLFLEPSVEAVSPHEQTERQELFEECRRAIDALPDLWRVILTLRDLEGRSYEEIGEILELPIGTVRSRLHRARARVRRKLDGRIGGSGEDA